MPPPSAWKRVPPGLCHCVCSVDFLWSDNRSQSHLISDKDASLTAFCARNYTIPQHIWSHDTSHMTCHTVCPTMLSDQPHDLFSLTETCRPPRDLQCDWQCESITAHCTVCIHRWWSLSTQGLQLNDRLEFGHWRLRESCSGDACPKLLHQRAHVLKVQQHIANDRVSHGRELLHVSYITKSSVALWDNAKANISQNMTEPSGTMSITAEVRHNNDCRQQKRFVVVAFYVTLVMLILESAM